MASNWAVPLVGVSVASCLLCMADTDGWSDLGKRSPFGGSPSSAAQGVPTNQLELRGVLVEGKDRWFNVYDTTKKKAEWVKESEAGGSYVVKFYDSAHDALTLEAQGQLVSIALKASTDLPDGNGTGQMVAFASTGLSTLPAVAPAPPKSEVKRFALVADLIRQRRALRSQVTDAKGSS